MKGRRQSPFLLLFLLAGSALMLFLALRDDPSPREVSGPDDKAPATTFVRDRVNDHLQQTSKQIEDAAAQARSQAAGLPKIGESLTKTMKSRLEDRGVDFSNDPREDQAYRDLNRHPKEYSGSRTAHAVIQNEAAQQELDERADKLAKEEYVRQFIENAKRHGYIIKVNDDFVVTSVQKVQNPYQSQDANLFDSAAQ